MPDSRFLYALTLFGYFATLVLLTAWYSWLAPARHFPAALVLLVLVVPLLFPLRGLLHGRRYTFAWSCFLALLYFTHGVLEAYSDDLTRPLGLLEITFSSLWFLGAMAYIKSQGKTPALPSE
jgi:uncharacterized membrane protein